MAAEVRWSLYYEMEKCLSSFPVMFSSWIESPDAKVE
jgi:hypothetical protein